jgi:murein DD-endopeptidase MepM/ murein hydrolase activator NlpD
MTAQPGHVRLRITGLLVAGTLAASCIEVKEGTPKTAVDSAADSAARAIAAPMPPLPVTPGITDDPGRDDPTVIRGNPAAVAEALKADTAFSLTTIDSAPSSVATDADLVVLRNEMAMPLSGVPLASLRDTYDELRGGTRRHDALDIAVPRGTPVLSATNGRVLKLFNSKAGGLMVYAADSSERFILMYGHLDAYAPGLAEGQRLRRGQPIGTVGTTGNAPPGVPHLHFAIARSSDVRQWWKGAPVNPFPLLAK